MTQDDTRSRILQAASEVFVEKGFRKTTVRDICAAADANVAAINYHFGDKKRLYGQVLEMWMHEFVEAGEPTRGITPESTPKERLRAYVRSELRNLCTFDDPNDIRRKRTRQLLKVITADEPEDKVFECHECQMNELLVPIVTEFVGPMDEAMLEKARVAATSVLTHYFIESVYDRTTGFKSVEELEEMTDFLTAFIVGGLTALKEKYNE